MISNKVELFKEKGYCAIKKPDLQFDLSGIIEARKTAITEIREELSSKYKVFETSIDSNDRVTDEYQIFYDESRVETRIINKLSEFVETISNERSAFNNGDHIYYRGHSSTNYKMCLKAG